MDGGVVTAVGLAITHERARKIKRTLLNRMRVLSLLVLYLIVMKTINEGCELVVPRQNSQLTGVPSSLVLYVNMFQTRCRPGTLMSNDPPSVV